MSEPSEFSESGHPVYRHQEREKTFEPAFGDSENIEVITRHIEQHIGPVDWVFHELISELVHIDVHIVAPRPDRNFYTLITTGMSDRPMQVPEGAEEYRHAELMICLPPDWKMEQKDFEDERNYWPVRMLKFLARFPHEYETWLGFEHTVPNGDPPEKFQGTDFCGTLIGLPRSAPPEFWKFLLSPERTILFYTILPLYQEEMDLKLKKGAEALLNLFDRHNVSELIDVRRKNVARKLFGLF